MNDPNDKFAIKKPWLEAFLARNPCVSCVTQFNGKRLLHGDKRTVTQHVELEFVNKVRKKFGIEATKPVGFEVELGLWRTPGRAQLGEIADLLIQKFVLPQMQKCQANKKRRVTVWEFGGGWPLARAIHEAFEQLETNKEVCVVSLHHPQDAGLRYWKPDNYYDVVKSRGGMSSSAGIVEEDEGHGGEEMHDSDEESVEFDDEGVDATSRQESPALHDEAAGSAASSTTSKVNKKSIVAESFSYGSGGTVVNWDQDTSTCMGGSSTGSAAARNNEVNAHDNHCSEKQLHHAASQSFLVSEGRIGEKTSIDERLVGSQADKASDSNSVQKNKELTMPWEARALVTVAEAMQLHKPTERLEEEFFPAFTNLACDMSKRSALERLIVLTMREKEFSLDVDAQKSSGQNFDEWRAWNTVRDANRGGNPFNVSEGLVSLNDDGKYCVMSTIFDIGRAVLRKNS